MQAEHRVHQIPSTNKLFPFVCSWCGKCLKCKQSIFYCSWGLKVSQEPQAPDVAPMALTEVCPVPWQALKPQESPKSPNIRSPDSGPPFLAICTITRGPGARWEVCSMPWQALGPRRRPRHQWSVGPRASLVGKQHARPATGDSDK